MTSCIGAKIKCSVYIISIFYIYTKDKYIITETLSAPVFIGLLNEKNREYTCRKEGVRARESGRESLRGAGQ